MIKVESVVRAEYEHCTDVQMKVDVNSSLELMAPEIVSLILCCYKEQPEITMTAIENALNRIGEDFIQEGLNNAKK